MWRGRRGLGWDALRSGCSHVGEEGAEMREYSGLSGAGALHDERRQEEAITEADGKAGHLMLLCGEGGPTASV